MRRLAAQIRTKMIYNHQISHVLSPWHPLNECLQEEVQTYPAHSNGKPDVSSKGIPLSVRFAPLSLIAFEVPIAHAPRKRSPKQIVVPIPLLVSGRAFNPKP
jgi:hypothetical protein